MAHDGFYFGGNYMKKSDFYREWARVLDMCEGTGILTKNAWKFEGRFIGSDTPVFIDGHDGYEFLIAILEGTPVFLNDELWHIDGHKISIGNIHKGNINPAILSWKEPKKTFMLNGVELPAATRSGGLNILEISDTHIRNFFYFDTKQDRSKVMEAIIKMLDDSTK